MVDLLNDTRQEVPGWLESLAFESHQNSGRNRQRRFDSIPLVCWLLFNPGPLGPVVQMPVSANPGLNFNPGFFFFLSKAHYRIIFSILFRVSSHQIVGKEN